VVLREGTYLKKAASLLFGRFEEFKEMAFVERLKAMAPPALEVPPRAVYRFKHSGNAGDIIYSLPALAALAKGSPAEIYLKLDAAARYGKRVHPLGNVMLNRKMFTMLKPLLQEQAQIAACEILCDQEIDFDLDAMRQYPFPQHAGHIARWYFLTFAVTADLGRPWLAATPSNEFERHIVVARSQRYRAPMIDYSFLSKYPRVGFVGIEAEFNDMRAMIPHLEYLPVVDFLQMAEIIAGSYLFIGNQSFPFSVAEGLKVRRLLEVCHLCPNVIVEGGDGYDFCYQPQFEALVRRLMD